MARCDRADLGGGLGFTHKWNLGWMHDTLDYLALDPVHRSHHHNEMTFAHALRLRRTLRAPPEPRRGRPRKGQPPAQDGRRRLAAVRRAAGAVRLAVVAARSAAGVHGRRTGAVAGVERRGGSPVASARPRRASGSARSDRRAEPCRPTPGRRCGGATPNRADSSGSTPTTRPTACTRSSDGMSTALRRSYASRTSRR